MASIITVPHKRDVYSRSSVGGKQYLFRFTYNDEGEFWTMGIYSEKKIPILQGYKLVPSYPINYHVHPDKLADGYFVVITNLDRVTFDSFATGEAKLMWQSADELSEDWLDGE